MFRLITWWRTRRAVNTIVTEPDDIGDEGGVPVEMIDLFVAIEDGATPEEFAALAAASWPAPEQD